ncbi:MAG: membrane protein insertase YidC [Kofleriaceae bacterium]|nr:membrane protein insertase YidC [Kofleriaceae bacterium]
MQDQGKRLLLAVVLALGVLLAFQFLFPHKEEPKKPDNTAQTTGAGSAAPSPTPVISPVGVTLDGTIPPAPATRGEEKLITLTFPNFVATFSSHGGVVKSWKLTDKRYEREKNKGELITAQQPDTGAFAVNFANSTYVLPPKSEWVGTQEGPNKVRYTISTDKLDVEKTFEIVPEKYLLKMTVKASVKSAEPAKQAIAVTTWGMHDPKDSGGGGQSVAPRVWDSSTYRNGEHYETGIKALIKKPRFEYGITWTGFEHPFLFVGMAPKPLAGMTADKVTFAEGDAGLMRTDMMLRPATVLDNKSQPLVREVAGFLGPKEYKRLEAADSAAGFSTGFHGAIDLGWFAFIGRPLMWLLLKFYSVVGNWGIAIMVLTVLVKLVTLPFITRSMRSMKAIAVLAPELKEIQAKYKDDRQRQQMETMALYRQHGANPLSGCLPLFLQMPIWLALYRMLSSAGELYLQPFIPGWINDLTKADPYHIMPIVLMVTMFVQARLQPAAPAADPTQKMQQRMMQYGLPLMFGVMSFFFPAGLTLYMLTNTVLSGAHSIYMNKYDKKSLALAEKLKKAQEKAALTKDGGKAKAADTKVKETIAKAKAAAPDEDEAEDDADDATEAKSGAIKPTPRPGQGKSAKRKKRKR